MALPFTQAATGDECDFHPHDYPRDGQPAHSPVGDPLVERHWGEAGITGQNPNESTPAAVDENSSNYV
jgi:hypothetical protein